MKIDNFTKTISWLETIEVSQQRPGTSESYLPFSFISIEPIHLDLPNFLQNVAIPYWISANLRNENISDIEEFDWIAFHARSSKAIVWCSIVCPFDWNFSPLTDNFIAVSRHTMYSHTVDLDGFVTIDCIEFEIPLETVAVNINWRVNTIIKNSFRNNWFLFWNWSHLEIFNACRIWTFSRRNKCHFWIFKLSPCTKWYLICVDHKMEWIN